MTAVLLDVTMSLVCMCCRYAQYTCQNTTDNAGTYGLYEAVKMLFNATNSCRYLPAAEKCEYTRGFIVVMEMQILFLTSFLLCLTHMHPSVRRAFKINELKTEVTNRLAMLEKRVERKSVLLPPTVTFTHLCHQLGGSQTRHIGQKKIVQFNYRRMFFFLNINVLKRIFL